MDKVTLQKLGQIQNARVQVARSCITVQEDQAIFWV